MIKLAFALNPDGLLRVGNDPHCVTKRQRPPLSPTSGQAHIGDLGEKELMSVMSQFIETLASYGVEIENVTFIEKTSMPRAIAPGETKPVMSIDLAGPDGNIFVVVNRAQAFLCAERGDQMWRRVQECTSYQAALSVINEYVIIVDHSGIYTSPDA